MRNSHLVKAAALCLAALLWSGISVQAPAQNNPNAPGKPDKPDKSDNSDKPGNGGADNKPAKVAWTPKRVEMDDVVGDTITVMLSSDKELAGVTFFTSGSLSGVIGLPGPVDVPAGETVEVVFELLQTPDEAGRTIGGTIQVLANGKHLAQPLQFSLKRLGTEETASESSGDEELMDGSGNLPLSWLFGEEPLENITLDLFDESGLATIFLVANRDLENLGLWFTPSSSACISASFDTEAESLQEALADESIVFEDGNIAFVAKGTQVPVLLELSNPEEWTCGGGTLHARSVVGNSRSFPQIVGVRLEKGEGIEDDPESSEVVAPVAIVDAASFSQDPIAPSQIVSIFGIGLGPNDQAVFQIGEDGKVSSYLNGTMVLFDGYPAPLLSASAGQINAIVPAAVRGGDVELQVLHNDRQSGLFPVALGRPTPGLFTLDGTGRGQAAAVNRDGTLNGAANPAGLGSVVSLFGSGGGPTIRPLDDGSVATEALRLAGDVRVFIGGVEADVLYAGTAPGQLNAVVQFNVRLNPQTPRGTQPVLVIVNGVESATTATIAVR
jgi:uncharacterized protein (TIGR03437 family)